jgi:hypothetical protein
LNIDNVWTETFNQEPDPIVFASHYRWLFELVKYFGLSRTEFIRLLQFEWIILSSQLSFLE